jgi:hypothetical protein
MMNKPVTIASTIAELVSGLAVSLSLTKSSISGRCAKLNSRIGHFSSMGTFRRLL